jgi:hypothetical protein
VRMRDRGDRGEGERPRLKTSCYLIIGGKSNNSGRCQWDVGNESREDKRKMEMTRAYP